MSAKASVFKLNRILKKAKSVIPQNCDGSRSPGKGDSNGYSNLASSLNVLLFASSSGVLCYHLVRLAVNLKKAGLNIIVVSGPKEQALGLFADLRGAKIPYYVSEHIDRPSLLDVFRSAIEIARISAIENINLIHTQGSIQTIAVKLGLAGFTLKKPSTITTIHYLPILENFQRLKTEIVKLVLNNCSDLVLAVCENTRKQLLRSGILPSKVHTMHNAIELDLFDCVSKKFSQTCSENLEQKVTIVCVANLNPIKGQKYLLEAAERVLKIHPAIFYIVGNGPDEKNLMKLARNLNIHQNVFFTGRIQWPELYPFIKSIADICVCSSISENFPFYILECMAARKPLVATNVGGISEAIFHGVNGYLVPPADSAAMAEAILKLLENPELARQMGLEGRRLVESTYSMTAMARKLFKTYQMASLQCS